jgi:dolichol-phosphate mannosyltransferase
MRDRLRRRVGRWLKFGTVGTLGLSLQLGTLTILKGYLGVHYLAATGMAVESAILHNFFWHERWTWGDRGLSGSRGRPARLVRFHSTTGAISILGNLVFMRLYAGELGLHYLVASLASVASCTVFNFVVSDRLVFLPLSPSAPR